MLYSAHMEAHTHAPHMAHKSQTTPKDFFFWLGAIIALYGAITSFFTLIFHYVDFVYPDPLSGWSDPYNGAVRVAMATIIVLTPTFLGLLLAIRRDIVREPGKATIWVRRWALMLTIFLAGTTAVIDLITLLTTFLGGDLTVRFALKAFVVLLLAILVVLHFLADLRGYWTLHRRKVDMVGAAVGALAIMTVLGGFWIIGSPSHIRELRYDEQRTNDLQSIQSQVVNYWQQKRALPKSLDSLNDPLVGFGVPVDPENQSAYEYIIQGPTTFNLCAKFDTSSPDMQSQGTILYPGTPGLTNSEQGFTHGAGHQCFTRTIDPDKYPASPKAL